jgi:outer membrane protein
VNRYELRERTVGALFAVGIVLASFPAHAANAMHWTVAGGVGYRPDYEGSNDYEPFPIGFARLSWDDGRYAVLKGTESSGAAVRAEGNLIPSELIQIGPVLQYRLKRNDVSSGRVDAMDTVDSAIELGGFLGVKFQSWLVRGTVAADASGEHDGTLVEFLGGYEHDYDANIGVNWHVASTWASDGYMGTYFTVDADDALASGLPTFDADAEFKDVGTRLSVSWAGDNWGPWSIIGIFSYFRMLGDAEDSPVVDEAGDPNQFFGGLAVGYSG